MVLSFQVIQLLIVINDSNQPEYMIDNLVSVIVPTYGGPDFLSCCVDSVLSQTYSNIEIIIVDDNGLGSRSQLETAIVMAKYESVHNVKYICHDVNKNGSATRNTGVKNSRGEYIALLDDDDIFLPDKIKRQVELLSSIGADYGAVYCSHETYLNEDKVGEEHALMDGQFIYDYMLHRVEISSSSLMVRRSVWDELGGFDESFKRHQDWEFIIRLLSKCAIKADDFFGFKRMLQFRNSSVAPQVVKERRLFYLNKMAPILNTFTLSQRNNIIVGEMVDVATVFLKEGDYIGFLREMSSVKPRLVAIRVFLSKFYNFCKRGGKYLKQNDAI